MAIYAATFETNNLAVHALGGCQVYGEPEDDVNWHGGNGSVYCKLWKQGLMLIIR